MTTGIMLLGVALIFGAILTLVLAMAYVAFGGLSRSTEHTAFLRLARGRPWLPAYILSAPR